MAEQINAYSEITPELKEMAQKLEAADRIDQELYARLDVKRGLRDMNGVGVLAGLTHVSDVMAKKIVNGEPVPDHGRLYYRGYEINDLIRGFTSENRFGYEETAYLLMIGELPTREELRVFEERLWFYRSLPTNFVRDVVLKAPSKDMMNTLSRSILTLYSYDELEDDVSLPNVLRQCMQLISLFPMLSIYGYQAYRHYHDGQSLYIHRPLESGSTAENVLHILRPDSSYTELEARILDVLLVLHMDHGGGNNSTFTTHVVTSTMTDTYSVMAAAVGALKGPRHGGANVKVTQMFEDMKSKVRDWTDEEEVSAYLKRLLGKEEFDKAGLIYGVGHAVYSLSDPRAVILKNYVRQLAGEKGRMEEYALYDLVERLAPQIIAGERKMYKGVSVNVDFYSGFVYEMLGLPYELFTPLFAIARIAGWSAHRLEELANNSKIIRPAFRTVEQIRNYTPIDQR